MSFCPWREDRPTILGIVNVTPDSFSDGGNFLEPDDAIRHAEALMQDGADFVDVGGESTRPGAEPVDPDEEWRRVGPVIRDLSRLGIPVSLDTRRSVVARKGLEFGVAMINDVSALSDMDMPHVCREFACWVCLMHMLGQPKTMQDSPKYQDVTSEVGAYLRARAQFAITFGVNPERIAVDPGFGFGKLVKHNVELLARLQDIVGLGYPVMVGVSRKTTFGKLMCGSRTAEWMHWPFEGADDVSATGIKDREDGSLAAEVLAVACGCRIIRTHRPGRTKRAIQIAHAVRSVPARA